MSAVTVNPSTLPVNPSETQTEIWKPVVGYEGLYEVSNKGRVMSYRRTTGPRILAQGKTRKGYMQCDLRKDGVMKHRVVHRLVAIAFIGDLPGQVNHKDGRKDNNDLSNLEIVTALENNHHSWRIGLCTSRKGVDHPIAKLNDEKVRAIRELYRQGLRAAQLSGQFGVSISLINYVVRGKIWKHVAELAKPPL